MLRRIKMENTQETEKVQEEIGLFDYDFSFGLETTPEVWKRSY
jgi:hypothetical protein